MARSTKVTVFFHLGAPKTGSTWLQEKVFPFLNQVSFLGKRLNEIRISKIHQDLFGSLKLGTCPPVRNNESLIFEYCKWLVGEIEREKPDKFDHIKILLSDENISSFANYNAELNYSIIFRIHKSLKTHFSNLGIFFDLKVLFVFRNQIDIIQSTYFYGYSAYKRDGVNIEKFVQKSMKSPKVGLFAGLWYDELFLHLNSFFDEENILFLPYELLTLDKKGFIDRIAEFMGIKINTDQICANEINKNSRNGKYGVRTRILSPAYVKLLNKFVSPASKRYFSRIFFFKLVYKILTQTWISRYGDADAETKAKISMMFQESNARLSNLVGINLANLGYQMPRDWELIDRGS